MKRHSGLFLAAAEAAAGRGALAGYHHDAILVPAAACYSTAAAAVQKLDKRNQGILLCALEALKCTAHGAGIC